MRSGAWYLMPVVGSILASGCSSSKTPLSTTATESTGSVAQPIQDGVADTKHRFAVGLCRGERSSDPSQACPGRCSGALILPNVVATARHCVDETPLTIDCAAEAPLFGARKGPLLVTTNDDMFGTGSTGWYTVKSYEVPDDKHVCGNDMALLVLSKNVPPEEATPVTPGVQYVMWDPIPKYVMGFTAIGYGQLGPGGTSGTRYRRDFINVVCVPGADSSQLDCPARAKVPSNEFVGGDGLCMGDSGSSAFERGSFERNAPVAFGVLSRGGEDDVSCAGSAYTRFDAHRDFVMRVAKAASEDWTLYPEPDWTTPKPRPARKPPKADASAVTRSFGETCTQSTDCSSQTCTDANDGTGDKICSQSCSEDRDLSSCPQSYECRQELCLPVIEVAPTQAAPTVTVKKSGCAASPASEERSTAPWTAVGLGMSLAVAARRRRSPRKWSGFRREAFPEPDGRA
jgi:hypothetical protein